MHARSSLWFRVTVSAAVVYAALFSFYTSLYHLNFMTTAYDLGTVDQGVWLAGRKLDVFVTVRGLPLLGDHVRPIAFVLAPIFWIWDDVRMLLVAQSCALATGAVILFLVGRRELPHNPGVAAAVSFGYLLNPFVQNLNMDHVHPDAFASTFLLASIYFLRTARHAAFWLAAALAMACKEDVPLVYVVLGVTLLFGPKWRLGVWVTMVSTVYFALCVGWIIPYFNKVGFFRARYFLQQTRNANAALVFLRRLFGAESGRYLWALGLPVGFVSLLAPITLAPASPQLAANLLNEVRYVRDPIYHYAAAIVPMLYLGAIDAAKRLGRGTALLRPVWATVDRRNILALTPVRAAVFSLLFLGCAVASNVTYSRLPLNGAVGKIQTYWRGYRTSVAQAEIRAALRSIPPTASVSADYTLVPHLSHRERIYMFPNPFIAHYWGVQNENSHDPATIDYIIVRPGVSTIDQNRIIDGLVASGEFERVGKEPSVRLYRRIRASPAT